MLLVINLLLFIVSSVSVDPTCGPLSFEHPFHNDFNSSCVCNSVFNGVNLDLCIPLDGYKCQYVSRPLSQSTPSNQHLLQRDYASMSCFDFAICAGTGKRRFQTVCNPPGGLAALNEALERMRPLLYVRLLSLLIP